MPSTDPEELVRRRTVRDVFASLTRADWSGFEGLAATRCAVAVAIPLLLGTSLGLPVVGVFGAVGALSVGFGSFQGAYRSRAALMLIATAAMAASIFMGSLVGGFALAASVAAGAWGFGGGLAVALGPAASFVGLQASVAVLVAGGFPAGARDAALRAALVLAGGLLQTLLVVLVWPLRRFPAERRTVGGVYRSLAGYAASLPAERPEPPEPHSLAQLRPLHDDPQPFARLHEIAAFQALLDEAERIRASLAVLARARARHAADGAASIVDACESLTLGASRALYEIGTAVQEGRAPRDASGLWASLETCGRALAPEASHVAALLAQLRAAWRVAAVPVTDAPPLPRGSRVPTARRLPPLRDAINTLRANLTPRSTAFRHALRLGATLAVVTAGYRLVSLERGYWLSLTVLLILKPEFQETFARALGRVTGTLLGAGLATLIAVVFAPGPGVMTALVLAFVWLGFAIFRINYTAFTVCITGYVVFLVSFAGVPEVTAAVYRAVDTLLGGAIGLLVYLLWPTWESRHVRQVLGALLEAQRQYAAAVLGAWTDPARRDRQAVDAARAAGRLARSNAEASVERMLGEPASRQGAEPRLALGVLAAVRQFALGALALHAGLDRVPATPQPVLEELARQIDVSLGALADAVRRGTPPPLLPPLRDTHASLAGRLHPLVAEDTDLIVDSINRIAMLIARDAGRLGTATDAGGRRAPNPALEASRSPVAAAPRTAHPQPAGFPEAGRPKPEARLTEQR